jgi:hypothetical protein
VTGGVIVTVAADVCVLALDTVLGCTELECLPPAAVVARTGLKWLMLKLK